jgi:hypothetical protein
VAEPSSGRSERPRPTPGFSRFGLFVGIVIVTVIGAGVVFVIARFLR